MFKMQNTPEKSDQQSTDIWSGFWTSLFEETEKAFENIKREADTSVIKRTSAASDSAEDDLLNPESSSSDTKKPKKLPKSCNNHNDFSKYLNELEISWQKDNTLPLAFQHRRQLLLNSIKAHALEALKDGQEKNFKELAKARQNALTRIAKIDNENFLAVTANKKNAMYAIAVAIDDELKTEKKPLFEGEHLAAVKRFADIVTGTAVHNQRVEALRKICALYQNDNLVGSRKDALNYLYNCWLALKNGYSIGEYQAQLRLSPNNIHTKRLPPKELDALHQEMEGVIKISLGALYGLDVQQNEKIPTLLDQVTKKYRFNWWATKKQQAVEQYLKADQEGKPETKRVARKAFDKAFNDSIKKVGNREKQYIEFYSNVEAVDKNFSVSTKNLSRNWCEGYINQVINAVSELYPAKQNSAYVKVGHDKISELLQRVRSSNFLGTWSSEYKKVKAFLSLVNNFPVNPEEIDRLGYRLADFLHQNGRSSDETFKNKLDQFKASVNNNNNWIDSVKKLILKQEVGIDMEKEHIDNFSTNSYPGAGFPAIGQTVADCEYFVVEIYQENKVKDSQGIYFDTQTNLLAFKQTETQDKIKLLQEELSKHFSRDLNTYFVLLILSVELARLDIIDCDYKKPFKTLVAELFSQPGNYSKNLQILKESNAPEHLTKFLPDNLNLGFDAHDKFDKIYRRLNLISDISIEPTSASKAAVSANFASPSKAKETMLGSPNNFDEKKSADHIKQYAKEIIDKSGEYNRIGDILTKNKPSFPEASADVLSALTLLEWYKTTANGKNIFSLDNDKKDKRWKALREGYEASSLALQKVLKNPECASTLEFKTPDLSVYKGTSLQKLFKKINLLLSKSLSSRQTGSPVLAEATELDPPVYAHPYGTLYSMPAQNLDFDEEKALTAINAL